MRGRLAVPDVSAAGPRVAALLAVPRPAGYDAPAQQEKEQVVTELDQCEDCGRETKSAICPMCRALRANKEQLPWPAETMRTYDDVIREYEAETGRSVAELREALRKR